MELVNRCAVHIRTISKITPALHGVLLLERMFSKSALVNTKANEQVPSQLQPPVPSNANIQNLKIHSIQTTTKESIEYLDRHVSHMMSWKIVEEPK